MPLRAQADLVKKVESQELHDLATWPSRDQKQRENDVPHDSAGVCNSLTAKIFFLV